MATITRRALYFTAPYRLEIREEPLPPPGPGEVQVAVIFTGISTGTEMLIYKGLMPKGMKTDATLPALNTTLEYPLKYGYASVGRVEEVGPKVDKRWLGRLVFAFQPHQSHFIAPTKELIPLPEDTTPEDAIFLPNMETAVNFLMDGRPIIGEHVVVLGQGVVGLLTTALLNAMPLSHLLVIDQYPLRLRTARDLGAHHSIRADTPNLIEHMKEALGPEGADLVYELSGNPDALNTAIAITGFEGRIIVGSWYGKKQAPIALGGYFHRSRIRIVSSQVSTIAAEHRARWDKSRRLAVALRHITALRPARLITHIFPAQRAANAYRHLDTHPEDTIQVLIQWQK